LLEGTDSAWKRLKGNINQRNESKPSNPHRKNLDLERRDERSQEVVVSASG